MTKDVDIARQYKFIEDYLDYLRTLEVEPSIVRELTTRFYNNTKDLAKIQWLKDYQALLNNEIKSALTNSNTYNSEESLLKKTDYELIKGVLGIYGLLSVDNENIEKATDHLNQKKTDNDKQYPHNPQRLVGLLKKFTQENHLKYSTHLWEKDKYKNYDDFVEQLKSDFNNYIIKIKYLDYKQDFYWQVLFPFLQQSAPLKDKQFKWGQHNLKVGWQYPSDFWSNLSEEEKEWPFTATIPENLRPIEKINGLRILKFHHIVELFKSEIEFKRSAFHIELEKLVHSYKDWHFEFINTNIAVFYTRTSKVVDAIKKMISNLDRKYPNCEFEISNTTDHYLFRFTQIDSFSNEDLNEGKLNIEKKEGDFFSIYKELYGLCDWSIVNKFNDGVYRELKYLAEGATINPRVLSNEIVNSIDAPKGFTHYLKFYK
jgi:hypothetical protein